MFQDSTLVPSRVSLSKTNVLLSEDGTDMLSQNTVNKQLSIKMVYHNQALCYKQAFLSQYTRKVGAEV